MRFLTFTLSVLCACSARPHTASPELPARPPLGAPIDRAGRPLTANALLGLFEADDVGDREKEAYNRASPADWPSFTEPLERGLAIYDGLDGVCGNQWLAARDASPARYGALARLLADDRLWVDGRVTTCTKLFGVELGVAGDCGGRTPVIDAVDVFRSRLAVGSDDGIDDGVLHDDRVHGTTDFPFLAAP